MGATDFLEYGEGADPERVFARLTEQAGYEHGHGGYSGTIAEKGAYRVVQFTPLSFPAARDLAERLMADEGGAGRPYMDKWGDCGAIPYYKPQGTRTVEVTVNPPLDAEWRPSPAELLDAAAPKIRLRADERAVACELAMVADRGLSTVAEHVEWKVTAENTKGKAVTRYVVKGSHRHGSWATGFASQAEARAYVVEALAEDVDSGYGPTAMEVESVTRRENGDPLVRVQRVRRKWSVKVTVTIEKAPPSPKVEGWLFFGIASM